MPLALSCDCFIVASPRLVLVGWASFLGIPVFLGMVVYMFLVVYRPFLSTSVCSNSYSAYWVSVSEGFLRVASFCGVVS